MILQVEKKIDDDEEEQEEEEVDYARVFLHALRLLERVSKEPYIILFLYTPLPVSKQPTAEWVSQCHIEAGEWGSEPPPPSLATHVPHVLMPFLFPPNLSGPRCVRRPACCLSGTPTRCGPCWC